VLSKGTADENDGTRG